MGVLGSFASYPDKNILSKLRLFRLEKSATILELICSNDNLTFLQKVQIYQHILYLLGNQEDAEDIIESTARKKIGEIFMRCLFKCEFYLMTLLAAVLFTVNSTAIGDQTDVSTKTTSQLAKKTDDHDPR